MLDTIRDYGRARLAGAELRLRRRHGDWYEQLVARARSDFISPRQPCWLDRLSREHANLRAAVEFSLAEPGRAEAVLRIAVTMPWAYWVTRGLFGEARRWIDAGIARVPPGTVHCCHALLLASCLAGLQGQFDAAARCLEQGEDLARSLNDPVGLVLVPYGRGMAAGLRNDLPTAIRLLEQALDRLSELPQPDVELRLRILLALGVDASLVGRREQADQRYRQILAIAEARGGSYYRSVALWAMGIEAFRRGDLGEATAQVTASLRIKGERLSIDRYGTTLCLETMASIAAGVREYRRAATLLGAADAVWDEMGTSIAAHGNLVGAHDACVRQARDHLGADRYARAFRHGRELSYHEAICYALDEAH